MSRRIIPTITFTPAADAFEAYREHATAVREAFYANNRPGLEAMTKAELMATGDVAIHETYKKDELVEDALSHMWAKTDVAKEYDRLMHLESRESEVQDGVTESQQRLAEARQAVANLAGKNGDMASLEGAMNLLKQILYLTDLWIQVAENIGPDKLEPLAAIRHVAEYATERAMDALEDNTTDLFQHRVAARWIRRNEHLIKALDYYK